jgi:hypothetical protein
MHNIDASALNSIMICDRLHVRLLEAYTLMQPLPCTPADRIDALLLLTTTSTTHYVGDVMHGGGLFVSG